MNDIMVLLLVVVISMISEILILRKLIKDRNPQGFPKTRRREKCQEKR